MGSPILLADIVSKVDFEQFRRLAAPFGTFSSITGKVYFAEYFYLRCCREWVDNACWCRSRILRDFTENVTLQA
jgi:hypothetical protein